MDTLDLSGRERERMIELAGDRYDPTTDTISLEVRPQGSNYDTVISILKSLYEKATQVSYSCTENLATSQYNMAQYTLTLLFNTILTPLMIPL